MYFDIPVIGMSDETYLKAQDVDENLIKILGIAYDKIGDAEFYATIEGVDNKLQKEEAVTQVDGMIYLLKQIKEALNT